MNLRKDTIDQALDLYLIPELIKIVQVYAKDALTLVFNVQGGDTVRINFKNPSNIKVNWCDDDPVYQEIFGVKVTLKPPSNIKLNWDGNNSLDEEIFGVGLDPHIKHRYVKKGIYTIRIEGNATGFHLGGYGSTAELTRVLSYGNFQLESLDYSQCRELVEVPNYLPPTVTNLRFCFEKCTKFNQLLTFNTSNVTDMSSMFSNCQNYNQPINFNTSKVTSMDYMFFNCKSFNQPINFNCPSLKDANFMFSGCISLNHPVIITNSYNLNSIFFMFEKCNKLNQLVSIMFRGHVKIDNIFKDCPAFNKKNWQQILP